MTTTWVEAAMTRAREALPRLQRDLDVARVRLDELRARQAAVERAAAALDPNADSDIVVAVRVAGETLPPLVAEAEAAVAAAMAARREARSALLPEPEQESAWSVLRTARQADLRCQGEMDAARLHLGTAVTPCSVDRGPEVAAHRPRRRAGTGKTGRGRAWDPSAADATSSGGGGW